MKIAETMALARLTTIGTGGPARAFAKPTTLAELEQALAWAEKRHLPVATVGLGSNLLASDDGVEALVLRLAGDLAAVRVDGETLMPAAARRTPSPSTRREPPVSAASSSRAQSRGPPAVESG